MIDNENEIYGLCMPLGACTAFRAELILFENGKASTKDGEMDVYHNQVNSMQLSPF
jgi:hypothetical protein